MRLRCRSLAQRLGVCLISLCAIALVLVPSAGYRTTAVSSLGPRSPLASQRPAILQTVVGGLWRTDHTFEATLRIKNELVTGPLTVTPVLFMADGTEYDLPPVTIESADVASIQINAALEAAPEWIRPHVSAYGSAAVRFSWAWNAVGGLVQNLDKARSLTYLYPFQHMMAGGSNQQARGTEENGGAANHQVIEGLWWKHDAGVEGFVGVTNTMGESLNVHVAVSNSQGLGGPGRIFELRPHTTELVKLSELYPVPGSAHETGALPWTHQRGGVTVSYDGPAEAILLSGGLENSAEGFSAPIVFRSVRPGKSGDDTVSYASVGIMVGNPDPMMEFPSGTKFTPYTILRNADSQPITVQPRLFYLTGKETKKVAAPSFQLLPHDTAELDVNALLAAAGVSDYSGVVNLEFSYRGDVGALIIASGSVDQTGTYVLDVSAKGIKQDRGKRVSYWENEGRTDSMFTLWNPDAAPEDLLVILYFHQGTYKVQIHLEPFGTGMFSISELASEQKPDADGHVLPHDAQVGSALIIDAADRRRQVKIVVSVGTINVETATCGENLCIHCDDIIALLLVPDPFGLAVNTGAQMTSTVTYTDNSTAPFTYQTPWQSNNTSVATVTSAGWADGVGPGSAYIWASVPVTVEGSACWVTGICDDSSVYDETPTTVTALQSFSVSITSTPISGESNSVVSGQSAQVQVQAKDNFGNVFTSYRGTVHFTSPDTQATLPSDYTFTAADSGSHTFNVTLKTVAGNSPTRDVTVKDNATAISSAQSIYVWFQVIATREGLVGGTTACSHVITQNDHFVALPATSLCNMGVRLRNGNNLGTTTVRDVGPWCPNTPISGGFNQCSCPSDRYWQTSGVPFAAGASCANTHAGIDLADGTFADLGLTTNGTIYWRFQ